MKGRALGFVLAVLAAGAPAAPDEPELRIGSKRFTESYILGEILVQSAQRAGARATHKPGLGNTAILVQALANFGVDATLVGEIAGPRVFDLQIALTAFEGGATELWTHDSRFVKIPGLRLHDPLA